MLIKPASTVPIALTMLSKLIINNNVRDISADALFITNDDKENKPVPLPALMPNNKPNVLPNIPEPTL